MGIIEQRPVLTISSELIDALINRKTTDLFWRAELLARTSILQPMLRSANRLGLNAEEQATVRIFAWRAGEDARKEVEESLDQSPLHQVDKILEGLEETIQKNPDCNCIREARLILRDGEQNALLSVEEVLYREAALKTGKSPEEVCKRALASIRMGTLGTYVGEGFTFEEAEKITCQLGVVFPVSLETVARIEGFKDDLELIRGVPTKIDGVTISAWYNTKRGAHNIPGRWTKLPEGISMILQFSDEAIGRSMFRLPSLTALE